MADLLALPQGRVFTKPQAIDWFAEYYPKIKASTVGAHLIRLSTNAPSRTHYNAKAGEHDIFFQLDGSRFRLYQPGQDPPPIYEHDKRSDRNKSPHREEDAREPTKILVSLTPDELARWRRNLIRLLNALEGSSNSNQREGLAGRIHRLTRAGQIPRDTAAFMIAVSEARNMSEYNQKRLSSTESEAVRNSWKVVLEWAHARGIVMEP